VIDIRLPFSKSKRTAHKTIALQHLAEAFRSTKQDLASSAPNYTIIKSTTISSKMLKFILLSILTLTPAVSSTINYVEVFSSIKSQSVWPVPAADSDSIVSTFGPRTKGTGFVYDFHRGIDIKGNVGDVILAAVAGEVVRILTDSKGEFTIILVHQLPEPVKLHEDKDETSRFYTVYMHCVSAIAMVGDVLNAGDNLATMGDYGGNALVPHLHLEVRLGTRCSLEYALTRPTSTCNTLDYDPAIHPLLLFPKSILVPSNVNVQYLDESSGEQTKVVRVSTPDDNPNTNAFKVLIINTQSNEIRDSHDLDLSRRVGFDATTNAALDTPDMNYPYLSPVPFGSSPDAWQSELLIPKAWYGTKSEHEAIFVEVNDIWGVSSTEVFGLDETW